jgi:hypothetical protein
MKRPTAIAGLLLPFSLYALAPAPASAIQIGPRAASVVLRSAILRVAAPNEFIKLTLPDGSEGRLQANTVIRIRRTISSERESGALTRIDWIQTMLVKEPPEAVVTLVGAALPSLGKLLLPDASPIWFNALAAEGPLPLADGKLQNGVLSGMVLGSRLQYLSSSPQQVHDEIAARGGSSLPVPAPFKGGERSVKPLLEVWDSDIRQ